MMLSTDSRFAASHGDLSWHALHTKHQHEKRVAEFLANREFEVFLPLFSEMHRWKDRNKLVSLPLFPCYVFFRGELG
jgi:hypothetical protein